MNRLLIGLLVVSGMCLLCLGCASPYYADRGAAWGGLTGAGVGAAIGNAKGDTLAGTAIGSAVGAVAGAVVGDSIDQRNLRQEPAGVMGTPHATPSDLVSMANAGIGSEVLIQHVQANGFAGPLTPADLVWMKQQGIQDSVLRVIQDAAQQRNSVPPLEPAPLVVEEHYYARPPFRRVHPRHYFTSRFCRPRAGFHVAWHD